MLYIFAMTIIQDSVTLYGVFAKLMFETLC